MATPDEKNIYANHDSFISFEIDSSAGISILSEYYEYIKKNLAEKMLMFLFLKMKMQLIHLYILSKKNTNHFQYIYQKTKS